MGGPWTYDCESRIPVYAGASSAFRYLKGFANRIAATLSKDTPARTMQRVVTDCRLSLGRDDLERNMGMNGLSTSSYEASLWLSRYPSEALVMALQDSGGRLWILDHQAVLIFLDFKRGTRGMFRWPLRVGDATPF